MATQLKLNAMQKSRVAEDGPRRAGQCSQRGTEGVYPRYGQQQRCQEKNTPPGTYHAFHGIKYTIESV